MKPEKPPTCFSCGQILLVPAGPIGRMATCEACDADIRCCRNCKFYDPAAYNECREPSAERVVEKTRSNFCDYFSLGNTADASADSGKEDALKKLDDLFK